MFKVFLQTDSQTLTSYAYSVANSDLLLRRDFPRFSPLPRSRHAPPPDNVFTGTTVIEFNDATKTKWSGNSLPSDTCLKNTDDSSTFTDSSDLPFGC